MMTDIIEVPVTELDKQAQAKYLAEEPERLRKEVEDVRRAKYQLLCDPLFFGFQRGDNTEQEWLDAVQAVKDANPYPEVPTA